MSCLIFAWRVITGQVTTCPNCNKWFVSESIDMTTGLCKTCHIKQEKKIYKLCQNNASKANVIETRPIWV